MSFLINPISFRLGYVIYWNNIWSLSNKQINYSFLIFKDYDLIKYLYKLFTCYIIQKRGLIYTNVKIIRINYTFTISIYFKCQDFFWFKAIFYYKRYFLIKYNLSLSKNFLQNSNIVFDLIKLIKKYKKYKKSWNKYKFKLKIYLFLLKKLYIILWYLNKKINWIKYKFFFSSILYIFYKYLLKSTTILIYYIFKNFIKTYELPMIKYCWQNNLYLTAQYLAEYLKHKLIQKYPVKMLFSNLFKKIIIGIRYFKGIKICFSGRATRRGRKLYFWKIHGNLHYSTKTNFLDYHLITVKLVNSLCGIKIWLNKKIMIKKYLLF